MHEVTYQELGVCCSATMCENGIALLLRRNLFGIMRHRWGDAITRFLEVALFATDENVLTIGLRDILIISRLVFGKMLKLH